MSTLREHFAFAACRQAKATQADKAAQPLMVRVACHGKTRRITKQRKLAKPEFLQRRGPIWSPGCSSHPARRLTGTRLSQRYRDAQPSRALSKHPDRDQGRDGALIPAEGRRSRPAAAPAPAQPALPAAAGPGHNARSARAGPVPQPPPSPGP